MLHGVEMYVINMTIEIGLIPNYMIPESVLPYSTPAISAIANSAELPLEAVNRIG